MRLTLELISELCSRAGISHPEKYHDATISGSGLTMAIQFRFKRETRLRLFVTAGELTTKNLRQITEYYLEHFWGKPDTEYSSLLIAHIFAMLVEDCIKTCETEQQEEPDKDIIRDPGPESGAPPGRERQRRNSGGKSSGRTENPQCQPAYEDSGCGRQKKRRQGNHG